MSEFVYVTAEGLARMQEEWRERTEVKRIQIAERLHNAIRMGDLSENADYHTAKEDQAFNEGRVRELEDQLARAQLITPDGGSKMVRVGSKVTIIEVGFEDTQETYRIVGPLEANPTDGFISNESPIGKALLGARRGQTVKAQTPGGEMAFKVVEIS